MALNKTKWLSLVMVVCFAILQALQPFIHAHLDAEHPIQEIGFHVGNDHEEISAADSLSHTVSAPHPSHTLSVASGIKQDINPMLANALVVIVLSFCFLVALPQPVRPRYFPAPLVSKTHLKRRLPAPRAPPQI